MDARPSERFKTVRHCLVLNNAVIGVIRLDVLRRTGGDRLYPHGDLVLMAELALYGRFLLLPDVLLYRRFGASTSSIRLARAELQALYYGDARGGHWLDRGRRHLDYVDIVLRAPIPAIEKLRLLPLIARHAGGDLSNMIMRAAARRGAASTTAKPGPSH